MKLISGIILITLITCEYSHAQLQSIHDLNPEAVLLEFSNQNTSIGKTDLHQIREKARFGNLLSNSSIPVTLNPKVSTNAFNLSFLILPRDTLQDYGFLVKFGKETMDVDWGEWSQDTLTYNLNGTFENFTLGVGYQHYLIRKRGFRLTIGSGLSAAFPISAIIRESLVSENGDDEDGIKLFGEKKMSLRTDLSLLANVRLFKRTYLSLGLNPGYHLLQLDGITKLKFVNGTSFGFRFYF